RPTEVLDRMVAEYIRDDAEELLDIVDSLLGSKSDELTRINCAASVAGQALYYLHAKALIERLHPDLPPAEERLEALIEHVTVFSLGGLEHIAKQAMNSER
ncbi:MAG: CerR family C-terminal domain-containing protein, partial [Pseudomonadota bacterium]|nr:CerR family C-terminal domain-containing protein [Pseudomonadota bacterium]